MFHRIGIVIIIKKPYLFVKLIGTDKGEQKIWGIGLTVVSVTFSMYAGLTMQQDR